MPSEGRILSTTAVKNTPARTMSFFLTNSQSAYWNSNILQLFLRKRVHISIHARWLITIVFLFALANVCASRVSSDTQTTCVHTHGRGNALCCVVGRWPRAQQCMRHTGKKAPLAGGTDGQGQPKGLSPRHDDAAKQ